MLVDGLRRRDLMSGWLGAGLAGLLVVGAAMRVRGQTPAHRLTAAGSGPAAVQTGKTRVHGLVTDPDGALIPGATVTLTGNGAGLVRERRRVPDPDRTWRFGGESRDLHGDVHDARVCDVHGDGDCDWRGERDDAECEDADWRAVAGGDGECGARCSCGVDPDSNASAVVLTGKDLDALSDDPDELSDELTALAGPSAGPNGGQIYVDGFTGGQLPPKSSIREIRINQNPFSAEYDQLGYGRVEVFTKPGTDKIHGNFQLNGNASQFNSGNPLATGYQPPYHTLFLFGNLTGPLNKGAVVQRWRQLSRH